MKSQTLIIDENHKYWLDGNQILGVNEIINSVFPFEGSGLAAERTANFGLAVHKAISLKIKGILNPATVDLVLKPYIEQFWKYFDDQRIIYRGDHVHNEEFKTEIMLYHKKYNYAGTIDLIDNEIVWDVKTGQKHPKHRLQIAAYRKLWNHNFPKDKKKIGKIIYLNESDKPPEIVSEKASDFNVFLSMLEIKKFKESEKL